MNATNSSAQNKTLDVEFDSGVYAANRNRLTLEALSPYFGKHVAFTFDGTRILASGADMGEVEEALVAAGIDPSRVVFSYVDDPSIIDL